MKSFLQLTF